MPHVNRTRSDAETAFNLMRTLAAARLLWAGAGALPLEDLAGILGADPVQLALAVEQLCDEGVAELCADMTALRLTERTVRELFRGEERQASQPRARVSEVVDAVP